MKTRVIDAIQHCGLTYVRQHELPEGLQLFEATHKVQNMAFGQYLLLPVTAEQFMLISQNSKTYAEFEDQVLAPFYFRLKGDWGWNLYMCFILEDAEIQRIPVGHMAQIERGKKYGKKLIINWPEITERLPAAKIPGRISGRTAVDPVEEWERTLSPLGLEFCLHHDYSESKLEAYLEQEETPAPRQAAPSLPTGSIHKPTGSIQRLRFGHLYRPHLLRGTPELQFAKVNLLYGPNGMGKTSILEGIELSFTGSIQRNILSNADRAEVWDGEIIFDDETVYPGTPEETEKKARETYYYKHKVAPRASSQINRVFHQYNYFSSEAVHQFCYNPKSRADYRNDFARVIFGEQLERMEQRWTQYSEEFRKQSNRLAKRIAEITEELEAGREKALESSALLRQRAQNGTKNMTKWMSHCKFAYPTQGEQSSINEIDQWLQLLALKINEVEILSDPLFEQTDFDIDNERSLNRTIRDLEKQEAELRKSNENTLALLGKLPNPEQLQTQAAAEKQKKERLTKESNDLPDLIAYLKDHQALFEKDHLRERRKEIQRRKEEIIRRSGLLSKVQLQYRHLSDAKLTIANIAEAQEEKSRLEAEYRESDQQFNDAAKEAEDLKLQVGKLQRLASELKAAGSRYLHEDKEETRCPLCSHNYHDHSALLAAIGRGLEADDHKITILLEHKESKRASMVQYQSALAQISAQIELYNELMRAHQFLITRQEELGLPIAARFTPDVVPACLNRMTKQLGTMNEEKKRIETEISELERQGFTLIKIQEIEQLLAHPALQAVQERSGIRTFEQMLVPIQTQIDRIHSEAQELTKKIDELEEELRQRIQEKQSLQAAMTEEDRLLKETVSRSAKLQKMRRAIELLRENHVLIKENDSWQDWRTYFSKMMSESVELKKILEPAVLLEHNAMQTQKLEEEFMRLTGRRNKSEAATEAFSRLRTLADFGDDFVKANFEAISRLFVALHAPNEFLSLELTDDNQIIARRKAQEPPCAVYQMSTGQRTAVILAIFFVMHLVMDTAPKFIMLDEPVANMDELNVLGLLDFLRQLVVTKNTQIFFTTANPQVATLFRRKFSFFEEDFKAYQFQRDPEGPVHIKIQQFKPQREKAVEIT